MQDRNVYSIPHCDIFVYLMINDNVEIIKAQKQCGIHTNVFQHCHFKCINGHISTMFFFKSILIIIS